MLTASATMCAAFLLLVPPADAQTRVPPFAFVSLDDSNVVISDASLEGKTYLVDFWASWCPPCVEEMPALTRAYEKFRERNFEIVSLSFDKSTSQIRRFRSKRWAMPWKHGLVERGFSDYLAVAFQVMNIPRAVLVSTDGIIVAEDEELRGEFLEKTIERFLK